MQIISGGQTGVDRAALDAAIALSIPHGGWCPLGRQAEDGPIPDRYLLTETNSKSYAVRTEQNVVDAAGTLIVYRDTISGGTRFTLQMARKHGRPHLCVDLVQPVSVDEVADWILDLGIDVLNVAGPRESTSPGIRDEAFEYLRGVFTQVEPNRQARPDG